MRPQLRQAKIIDFVQARGQVSVEDLAGRFGASHETIRRDLNALAEAGIVQKVHGGAKLPGGVREGPFRQRMTQNAGAKRAIAVKAASIIEPGAAVFIDTGTTTLILAEELTKTTGLTVITNSTRIAEVIAAAGNKATVFLLGGRFDTDNREAVGPLTISEIQRFRADHAIIGVGAVSVAGCMDFNFDEAQIARAMVDHADHVVALADSSKLSTTAPFRVCGLDRVDMLVSERAPEPALHQALATARVALL